MAPSASLGKAETAPPSNFGTAQVPARFTKVTTLGLHLCKDWHSNTQGDPCCVLLSGPASFEQSTSCVAVACAWHLLE